jgi:hypothetical protein
MPPSGVLCRVALERNDVSEDRCAFIIRVAGIGESEEYCRIYLQFSSVGSYC